MRISIFFLFLIIVLLLSNVLFYSLSEEYRFFITKIRYQDSIVELQEVKISDSVLTSWEKEVSISLDDERAETSSNLSLNTLEFLETISDISNRAVSNTSDFQLLPSTTTLSLLDILQDYKLTSINSEEYLFSVTSEYPDPFLQWHSTDLSFYSFPTKSYREVFDIFDVLSFELPISINQVNNIADKSFFINMDTWWDDGYVRVVFEYKNEAFWLKIKNIHYNRVRDTLAEQL